MLRITVSPIHFAVLAYLLGASFSAITSADSLHQIRTAQTGNGTGVSGRISQSPMTPGPERIDQVRQAAPLAKVKVQLLNRKQIVVATAVTDREGKFEIRASPDTYTLIVDLQAKFPRCENIPVTIRQSQMTNVEVDCDSGMR